MDQGPAIATRHDVRMLAVVVLCIALVVSSASVALAASTNHPITATILATDRTEHSSHPDGSFVGQMDTTCAGGGCHSGSCNICHFVGSAPDITPAQAAASAPTGHVTLACAACHTVTTAGGDTTPPVITVNVAEGGSYAAPKTVTFSANDAAEGPVASTATLNGSPFTSGASVSTPGSYTLVVDASDSVPNSSASTIHFTVTGPTGSDSEGPVIAASVSEGGSYLAPATVTFSAIDAVEGPAPATATLNGNPFTSGSSISALGNYTLVITASDSVPNTSVSTIHFTLAAPVVSTPASSDWSIALLAVVGLGVAVVVRRRHAPDLR